MTDFYTRLNSTANRLLTKYKQGTVIYTPSSQPANEWEGVINGTPIELYSVVSGVSQKYISDTVSSSDLMLTCSAIKSPLWDNLNIWDNQQIWDNNGIYLIDPNQIGLISIDGEEKSIIKIMKIPAAGDPVVFKIFIKG